VNRLQDVCHKPTLVQRNKLENIIDCEYSVDTFPDNLEIKNKKEFPEVKKQVSHGCPTFSSFPHHQNVCQSGLSIANRDDSQRTVKKVLQQDSGIQFPKSKKGIHKNMILNKSKERSALEVVTTKNETAIQTLDLPKSPVAIEILKEDAKYRVVSVSSKPDKQSFSKCTLNSKLNRSQGAYLNKYTTECLPLSTGNDTCSYHNSQISEYTHQPMLDSDCSRSSPPDVGTHNSDSAIGTVLTPKSHDKNDQISVTSLSSELEFLDDTSGKNYLLDKEVSLCSSAGAKDFDTIVQRKDDYSLKYNSASCEPIVDDDILLQIDFAAKRQRKLLLLEEMKKNLDRTVMALNDTKLFECL